MGAPKLLAVMLAVSCFAWADAKAQPAPAQPQMPRGPIKTPLGRSPAEVLGSKVVVSDMVKSFDFYTRVVGLRPAKSLAQTEPLPPPGADTSQWPVEYGFNFSGSFGDAFFDILRPRSDSKITRESADLVTLIFKVPDARAVIRRAKELGYEVIREAPAVRPGEMSIGFIRDPDGYRVEIIQAADYPKEK
jgi:catechol 2,3-dioxygenase-like lactoylglutathione lyase family enzyme